MSSHLLVPTSPRGFYWPPGSSCDHEELNRKGGLWGTALTKTAAEDLLDWLETHGHGYCQVSYVVGEGFTVME